MYIFQFVEQESAEYDQKTNENRNVREKMYQKRYKPLDSLSSIEAIWYSSLILEPSVPEHDSHIIKRHGRQCHPKIL